MDSVTLIYAVLLAVAGTAILVWPLVRKGDERITYIHRKAQTYSFLVMALVLLLQVVTEVLASLAGKTAPPQWSPLTFFTTMMVIYLLTLIVYRKKYGQ